jgi:hypothetical protein
LWRLLRGVFLALVAVILFLEEWGWRPLAAWLAGLARWPPWARLEARIARVPPRWALWLFLLPVLALLPVKILALWLLREGRTTLGLLVIIGAKLVGTALGGRLFVLLEPRLMQLRRFAQAMTWWRRTRRRVRCALRRWGPWRALRASARALRERLRAWWA